MVDKLLLAYKVPRILLLSLTYNCKYLKTWRVITTLKQIRIMGLSWAHRHIWKHRVSWRKNWKLLKSNYCLRNDKSFPAYSFFCFCSGRVLVHGCRFLFHTTGGEPPVWPAHQTPGLDLDHCERNRRLYEYCVGCTECVTYSSHTNHRRRNVHDQQGRPHHALDKIRWSTHPMFPTPSPTQCTVPILSSQHTGVSTPTAVGL